MGILTLKHVLLDEVLLFKLRYGVYITLVKFRQRTSHGYVPGKIPDETGGRVV